jgi:hypothetical protein
VYSASEICSYTMSSCGIKNEKRFWCRCLGSWELDFLL